MKTILSTPIVLGSIALAVSALLPSCVDPYGPGPQPVATYRTGYEVRTLPPGYRTEVIAGNRYYSSNGTYYRSHSGRYVVVEAPHHYNHSDNYNHSNNYRHSDNRPDHRPGPGRDVTIHRLPSGYRTVDRHGVRYYQVHDTYYQKRGSGYVVVSRP